MSGKLFSVEQTVRQLREVEILLAQSKRVGEICRQVGSRSRDTGAGPASTTLSGAHSALGYGPPAPETILPHTVDLPKDLGP